MRTFVCRRDELDVGKMKAVDCGGRSIVVGRCSQDEFVAVRNTCPHQGARLSDGELSGTTLPCKVGEYVYGHEAHVFRCPWHAWEFDARTGTQVFVPNGKRVKTYPVHLDGDDVYVDA